MRKALVVARNEYLSAVSSKAFLFGVLLMPVFMGGALAVQHLTKDQIDVTDRKVAVVDPTGELFAAIARGADARNEGVFEPGGDDQPRQVRPKFLLEEYTPNPDSDQPADAVLSERVRDEELFGFLIVEPDALSPDRGRGPALAYHTQTPSFNELPRWLEQTVNDEVRRLRMRELNVDPQTLAAVSRRVPVRRFGLVEADQEGKRVEAKEENRVVTFVAPFGGMMLMFMLIMTVAPTMLNNVLEEKMQKISEFLVSSVTPFQLMLGKLLGGVAVALTLSTLYLGAAYGATRYFEVDDMIPPTIYLWFLLFLFLALLIFGSIFSAIGAACSEIRDAQGLMTPVMLTVVIPMLCLGPVLQAPSSTFSRMISLFPPATPMLMFLRIAIPPGPPAWEIALGVVLSVAFAAGCVGAAGKVFRYGVLSQGQPPSAGTIFRWVTSGD